MSKRSNGTSQTLTVSRTHGGAVTTDCSCFVTTVVSNLGPDWNFSVAVREAGGTTTEDAEVEEAG